MSFQPYNVLVTGGAGFIGANFIRCWLEKNTVTLIVNLDLLNYAGSKNNLINLPNPEKHSFIQGNINNKALVLSILKKYKIDTIVHFAAETHVDRSIAGPNEFIQTNIVGTFTLLEAAREYWLEENQWDETLCRFHHISTDEVFGSLTNTEAPFAENHPYAPNSPYSASKASADHIVRSYHCTYGLPMTISHCSNNYGPYQHAEKFIPTVIRSCFMQKSIPIYGDGSHIRDWIYVEDHCLGILAILQQGKNGNVYNLGGDCEKSNLTLAKEICELFDKLHPNKRPHEQLIQFVKDRPGHDWRYAINSSKAKKELTWQCREDFINGLQKTISFYRHFFIHQDTATTLCSGESITLYGYNQAADF